MRTRDKNNNKPWCQNPSPAVDMASSIPSAPKEPLEKEKNKSILLDW